MGVMGQHEGAGAAGLAEEGSRVTLRPLSADDQDEFLELARASVSLHYPWYSMPTTVEEFQAYLTRLARPGTESLAVCVRGSGAIAGHFTLDNIVRGRFQSATLSYAAFAPAAGQGYMSEGLGLVLRYAFQQLRLHRVEASIQPGNEASLRLVRRHGFRKEGFSPNMLFIDGSWRDHERWAITREMTSFPPVAPHPTRPGRLRRGRHPARAGRLRRGRHSARAAGGRHIGVRTGASSGSAGIGVGWKPKCSYSGTLAGLLDSR